MYILIKYDPDLGENYNRTVSDNRTGEYRILKTQGEKMYIHILFNNDRVF